jgi:hypothetical protein
MQTIFANAEVAADATATSCVAGACPWGFGELLKVCLNSAEAFESVASMYVAGRELFPARAADDPAMHT